MPAPDLVWQAQRFLADPAARTDPYRLYDRLRTEAPVLRTPGGAWLVTRYGDVRTVLTSRSFGVDLWAGGGELPFGLTREDDLRYLMMSFRDPPEHTRMRRLVARWFTEGEAEDQRDRVGSVVASMLAAADPGTAATVDLVADLGRDLPVNVSCALLGIAGTDLPAVRRWTDCLARHLERMGQRPDPTLSAEQEAFSVYVERLLLDRGSGGGPLGALAEAHETGVSSWAEVVAYVMLLLVAGRETVTNLVGVSVVSLLRHPDQAAALRESPQLLAATVHECLRHQSPVRLVAGIVLHHTVLGGVELAPGDLVLAVLEAANRDPEAFGDPDRFDITRTATPGTHAHLALGAGPHHCLGAALGRVQAEEVVRHLFVDRHRDLRPLFDPEAPSWAPSLAFRGPSRLPVTFAPRRPAAAPSGRT